MAAAGWFTMPSVAFEITVLSALITTAVYTVLFRTQEPTLFTNLYLLTIALKLVMFGVTMFLLRDWVSTDLASNAVFLIITYAALTSLEVGVLFRKVNH